MPEDKKDPVCGMKGTLKAHDHYFCSTDCMKKYEEKHNLYCASCEIRGEPFYKQKLFIVSALLAAALILSFYFEPLQPFAAAFIEYAELIWWAILLGLLIGGIIEYLIPKEYITKFLAKPEKKTILYSIGLGFIMAACSHGILAISMELYKKGASAAAVIAFLLASPWANLPVTILLFGFFGFKAFFFVGSAIVIAVITGLIYQVLEEKNIIEKSPYKTGIKEGFSVRKDVSKRLKKYKWNIPSIAGTVKGIGRGSWTVSKMVLWWILIGMTFAGLARAYVPHEIFMDYLGPTIIGLFLTLLIATIIEVCSEGSSPMAFELYSQTGAFGNAFTFLMAGVVTDYTEIGLIWQNIGKKAALALPLITVPQVLILAYIYNLFL